MDIKFNKNENHNKLLVSDLRQRFAKVKLGGVIFFCFKLTALY